MCESISFLHEVFQNFGSISSHKMFSDYSIYHDGVIFGLVADDALYLKADNLTQQNFTDNDLSAFEYNKGDKKIKMSYFLAPEEVYDNLNAACYWDNLGCEAVLRAKPNK